ncbi:myelin protein P0 isoform X2 [Catharus ustulatus]|uniref:myelin protein P0 isoform X2 n=1 Tax=Catharus ustulatus TaxID=91951 RepID=UPI001407A6DE|nr:myelin protein P0 isoform X2 [Catharus ustulatus]
MSPRATRHLLVLAALVAALVSPVSPIHVYTQREVYGTVGASVTLSCSFWSSEWVSDDISVTWHFQAEGSRDSISIFHYAQGQPYIDDVGSFKERMEWAGNPRRRDGSIIIHGLEPSDNGTFTCDVKNPPDIVGKSSQVTLYVLERVSPRYGVVLGSVIAGVLLLVALSPMSPQCPPVTEWCWALSLPVSCCWWHCPQCPRSVPPLRSGAGLCHCRCPAVGGTVPNVPAVSPRYGVVLGSVIAGVLLLVALSPMSPQCPPVTEWCWALSLPVSCCWWHCPQCPRSVPPLRSGAGLCHCRCPAVGGTVPNVPAVSPRYGVVLGSVIAGVLLLVAALVALGYGSRYCWRRRQERLQRRLSAMEKGKLQRSAKDGSKRSRQAPVLYAMLDHGRSSKKPKAGAGDSRKERK